MLTIKIIPASNAVEKIAFGSVFSASLVSSASEDKASKPVKEKHSTVAPPIKALIEVISFQKGVNDHNSALSGLSVPSAYTPWVRRIYT